MDTLDTLDVLDILNILDTLGMNSDYCFGQMSLNAGTVASTQTSPGHLNEGQIIIPERF